MRQPETNIPDREFFCGLGNMGLEAGRGAIEAGEVEFLAGGRQSPP